MTTTQETPWRATTADHIRWQGEALHLLNEVWRKGARAKLEPLMWQLGASGIGGMATDLDMAAREATLRAWADLLGLDVRDVTVDGIHRLLAMTNSYGKAKRPVAIHADIYEDTDRIEVTG